MERKIGEMFEYWGEWYQCVENCVSWCASCDFRKKDCNTLPLGPCDAIRRSDKRCAIFKKLKPVGDPYPLYGHIVQRYAGVKFPVALTEKWFINCNAINNTIDIEVKQQNKEDMEEKKIQLKQEDIDYLTRKIRYLVYKTNDYDRATEEIMNLFIPSDTEHSSSEKIGKNLKPFDLEAAKAGKPVCTRDGRKVRIICFDRINGDYYKIVACVTAFDGDFEEVLFYGIDGYIVDSQNPKDEDLMMLPEKKEGWILLRKDGCVFDNEEVAKKNCTGDYFVAKVEWEE